MRAFLIARFVQYVNICKNSCILYIMYVHLFICSYIHKLKKQAISLEILCKNTYTLGFDSHILFVLNEKAPVWVLFWWNRGEFSSCFFQDMLPCFLFLSCKKLRSSPKTIPRMLSLRLGFDSHILFVLNEKAPVWVLFWWNRGESNPCPKIT